MIHTNLWPQPFHYQFPFSHLIVLVHVLSVTLYWFTNYQTCYNLCAVFRFKHWNYPTTTFLLFLLFIEILTRTLLLSFKIINCYWLTWSLDYRRLYLTHFSPPHILHLKNVYKKSTIDITIAWDVDEQVFRNQPYSSPRPFFFCFLTSCSFCFVWERLKT